MVVAIRRFSAMAFLVYAFLLIGCDEDKGGYVPGLPDVSPPSRVTSLEAWASGDSSITLRWLAPSDDPRSGVAARYEIRYQKGEQDLPWWTSATTIMEMESEAPYFGVWETVTISGLVPAQTYFFALKAADEVPNWSEMSNVAEVYLSPVIPPDVSGRWVGIANGMWDFWPSWEEIGLDLSQSGYRVTGTYELGGDSGSLHSGAFLGNQLVFVIRFESRDFDYVFTGTLLDDHIDGVWWIQSVSTGEVSPARTWYVDRIR